MRISKTQKDVLLVLYHILSKGVLRPIPSADLLAMINSSRDKALAASNFRVSCHTLADNGLIQSTRGSGLQLQWQLTQEGIKMTTPLYAAWINPLKT